MKGIDDPSEDLIGIIKEDGVWMITNVKHEFDSYEEAEDFADANKYRIFDAMKGGYAIDVNGGNHEMENKKQEMV